jgi:cell division septal protein FtsQ
MAVLRRLPWRLMSLVGGSLLVAWFVWSLFNIRNVEVTTPTLGNNVKSEVQALLDKSPMQNNLLTLNTGKLTTSLIAIDPQLKAVEVHRHWPSTIEVIVTQKQPALAWSTGNQSYLLDRDGTVIGSLPSGSTLPTVVDGSNLPVQRGQQVVTANFVTFCNNLLTNLPAAGITVRGLRVQDTTFDLYVQTNKGYQLIFDTTRPAADEVADLKTVEKTLAGKVPSQYIDLRIKGKAYYQ